MRRTRVGLYGLTNWHSVTSGLLASDEGSLAELCASLVADRPHVIGLQFLPANAWPTPELARLLEAAGYRVLVRPLANQSFVTIDGDYESFLAGASRNLRGDVRRRRRRRLEEAGALTLDVVDGGHDLDKLLDEGFAIEGSGWKTEAGTAINSSPITERFYREVAAWAAATGVLRLCYLRLDGRCIAFQYNVVAEGVLYDLKGGYDTAYERFSPGKVLHAAMLRHSFEDRLRRYEFLGVAEPYKLHWATGSRQTVSLRAFAPSIVGRGLWAGERYGRPAAKRTRAAARRMARRDTRDEPESGRTG